MKIVADENIPYVADAFGHLGDVTACPAAAITPSAVRDAHILLVRSVTRIDETLLGSASVRFVGTATIGVDHVDTDFLRDRGIAFASAPGSNANSVSEWVMAGLLAIASDRGFRLSEQSLGIVGAGNVGRRVHEKARALGMRTLLNDPPRARREGPEAFVPLDRLLAESTIVTLHVPLYRTGPDRTLGMADRTFFERLRPGAAFLNSSRGAVVNESALTAARAQGRPGAVLLDVWADEPAIAPATVACTDLATPHIAGYSFDGKVGGTRMIYEAACQCFGVSVTWDAAAALPPPDVPETTVSCAGRTADSILDEAVRAVYDIRSDDRRLRSISEMPPNEIGPYFTELRRSYPRRRAFRHTRARLVDPPRGLCDQLSGLGFRVE